MQIAILADDESWKELGIEESESITRVKNNSCYTDDGISGFIQLTAFNEKGNIPEAGTKPYFINDVLLSSTYFGNSSIIPFNGWKGFIAKAHWEMAGTLTIEANQMLLHINKKPLLVPAICGFISPRVISMIINEAWFALEEKVSSKEDIDIAMKLGTNYPYGPFEWGNLIGLTHIYTLLKKLEQINPLYKPSPLLTKQVLF